MEDDTYKQGPIGLFGLELRVLWDNVVGQYGGITQPGTKPAAVQASNKLALTWGRIKSID